MQGCAGASRKAHDVHRKRPVPETGLHGFPTYEECPENQYPDAWKEGEKLYTTPPAPQPVPVKTYHDGKPWPVAPKPWVNLTVDELIDLEHKHRQHENLVRAIEAKLKEKNT